MIQSTNVKLHQSILQALNARNEVTANNIANADTPHYKRKTVVFEDELRKAIEGGRSELELKTNNARHMTIRSTTGDAAVPFRIVEDKSAKMNNNNNSVDIDVEMATLSETQLMYNYTADRVSGHYKKYKEMLQSLK